MKKEHLASSEVIKLFMDFIAYTKSEYNYSYEALKNEDSLTQDYLHKLELEEMNCRERSKVATQLSRNRKARRNYKDIVEELEPIVKFFEEPQNRSFINHLSQLLGQVRKIENYHQNRFYIPKAIINQDKDVKGDTKYHQVIIE